MCAGHAIAGWYCEHALPLLKVSIVPRGSGALGYAQYVPKEQFLKAQEELEDTLCLALGGRIAEQLFGFGFSSGAQNDLERVTQMAYRMVQEFGMSEHIGQMSFPKSEQGGGGRLYGENTAQVMDAEAKKLVDEL